MQRDVHLIIGRKSRVPLAKRACSSELQAGVGVKKDLELLLGNEPQGRV